MTSKIRAARRQGLVTVFLAAVVGLLGAGPASATTASAAQGTFGATVFGAAQAAAVTAPYRYDPPAYAYDGPARLSSLRVTVEAARGAPSGLAGASWEGSFAVGRFGVAAEGVVTASRIGTGATSSGSRITLDAARAAAERNGIGTRLMDLGYEAGAPGQYGYTSFNGAGQLIRGSSGRFQTTLTDLGLRSEQDAVNTIAHELNHIRESLATGGFPAGEGPANLSGDLAELFFR